MSLFGSSKPIAPDFDFSITVSLYTNDLHIASSDDEVIVTFGVRPLPSAVEAKVPVQRVYMSFFTAKRLLIALQMSVEKHEKVFGPVAHRGPSESIAAPEFVARATYANFVRVTGSPEELTIDCGVNANLTAQQAEHRILIHSQVGLNFVTAKSLSQQLSRAVHDYESRHGTLELDISKRVP